VNASSQIYSPAKQWLSKLTFNRNSKHTYVELQSEASECGIACLVMISHFYKKQISLRELRQAMPASQQGVSLQQIMEYAQALNLSTRAVKLPLSELKNLSTPAILHWDMNHFVVLNKVSRRGIHISDPAIGKRFVSWAEVDQAFTGIALELSPTKQFQKQEASSKLKLFDFATNSAGIKRHLFMLLGLSVMLQFFALAAPFYMQTIVDSVIASNNTPLLNVITFGFALLLLIETGSQWLRDTVSLRFSTQFNVLISSSVFAHLLALPISYFQSRHMGDVVSRFGSLQPVQNLLTQGLVSAIIDGLLGIFTLALMCIYSLKLALLVCLVLVIYCLVRWALYIPIKALNQEVLHSEAKHNSFFMQSVRAIRTIKLSNTSSQTHANWLNKFINSINQKIALERWNIRFSITNKCLFGIENLVVIYVAVGLVQANELSIGMLFAFISYKSRFIAASSSLIDQWIEFKLLGVHLHRLEDIVFTSTENQNKTLANKTQHQMHAITTEGDKGASLVLENISFTHTGQNKYVFEQLNMRVEKGQFIAIVGASGCGKTSLLNCLLGLNDVASGTVHINNSVLNTTTRHQHRIGAVMQHDELLNGSILDNISQFSEHVDLARVIKCATLACIHNDILAMTMQYQTLIGDMGDSLSGGQKQRILLARALYQTPQLLILDEATSHLDVQNEALVCRNLTQLPITIIMVAHRPQAIQSAQKIYTLSKIGLTENSYSSDNLPPSHSNKDDNYAT